MEFRHFVPPTNFITNCFQVEYSVVQQESLRVGDGFSLGGGRQLVLPMVEAVIHPHEGLEHHEHVLVMVGRRHDIHPDVQEDWRQVPFILSLSAASMPYLFYV